MRRAGHAPEEPPKGGGEEEEEEAGRGTGPPDSHRGVGGCGRSGQGFGPKAPETLGDCQGATAHEEAPLRATVSVGISCLRPHMAQHRPPEGRPPDDPLVISRGPGTHVRGGSREPIVCVIVLIKGRLSRSDERQVVSF